MLPSITTYNAVVHFGEKGYQALNEYIEQSNPSGIFVLVDENTHPACLPVFLSECLGEYSPEIIEVAAGEENKQIETCSGVWSALAELGCNRRSLLINLGGGVITDMGGFIAATFMRGIPFINIPTSLLSMVDASVGGKTGVDLNGLKNLVGIITEPEMVIVDEQYLNTLDARQMRSGLAEMLKHGLICDAYYWKQLSSMNSLEAEALIGLIHHSVHLKNEVVKKDPTEKGLRKILNFGHTLGHAIETYFLQHPDLPTLLHGEAIAAGMIMEAYLAVHISGLSLEKAEEIKKVFDNYFPKIHIDAKAMEAITSLMIYDKKNTAGNINFVLLEDIGQAITDQIAGNTLITKALSFYNN